MHEVALFRTITTGTSRYVTVAERYLPPGWRDVTITVVNPETWTTGRPLYGHLHKHLGARINNSYKIVINKHLLEQLSLADYKGKVWLRITEQDPNPPPPPPKPYIAKMTTVYCDGSSYFITISESTLNTLKAISPGKRLKITVHAPRAQDPITYIKRPVPITGVNIYKVVLPSTLFEGLVRKGETVHVKLETTDELED